MAIVPCVLLRAALLVLALGVPAVGAATDFELRFPTCVALITGEIRKGGEPSVHHGPRTERLTCTSGGGQVACKERAQAGTHTETSPVVIYAVTRDRFPEFHFGTAPGDTGPKELAVKVNLTEGAAIKTTVLFVGWAAMVTVCTGTYHQRDAQPPGGTPKR